MFCGAVRVKSTDDDVLKYQIYNTNSKVVVNYSMKDFDPLFFEFSDKKNDPKFFITTEQLSRNTIKFAAFSDRLVKLYPKEQVVALEGKKR